MTRHLTTVTPNTSILAARRLLNARGVRHLPVVEGGALVGIVSDRDLTPGDRYGFGRQTTDIEHTVPREADRKRAVRGVMSTPVRSARPGDALVWSARQLLSWRISALPVVEDDRLVGILTTTDCLEQLLDAAETPVE